MLRFDGVESWYKVWLNGKLLGFSTGSRLPTEFDVTSALSEKNVLAVRVHQWSAATYVEDQDQWWMPGIVSSTMFCQVLTLSSVTSPSSTVRPRASRTTLSTLRTTTPLARAL